MLRLNEDGSGSDGIEFDLYTGGFGGVALMPRWPVLRRDYNPKDTNSRFHHAGYRCRRQSPACVSGMVSGLPPLTQLTHPAKWSVWEGWTG